MIFLRSKRLEKKTSDAREPSLYRSICTSIISTLLSLVMLVGTTFAWFTDSITTGVYTIQAGNLETAMYFRTELPDESSTSEPMWFPLNEGNMSMFGGMTFTSEASQTAYLKLVNSSSGDVVYKFRFASVGAETPGTLKNEETVQDGKILSEMLSFEFASADEVTKLKDAALKSKKLADFAMTSAGESATTTNSPFEVTVAQGQTVYAALTIAMDKYDDTLTWETQPSIQLRLQIDISNTTLAGESQTSRQLMAAPPIVMGVYNVANDSRFVTVTQTEQLATEKAETDDTDTSGAAEDGGNADTSGGAVDTAADTAAVEPNAADDVPAADPAA